MREPTIHFILAGAVVWAFISLQAERAHSRHINVSAFQLQQINETFEQQFGRRPTAAERADAIQRYVDDEIAYREGLALGLERDDVVVRRRVIQKFQFLQEDRALVQTPGEPQLRKWFHARRSRWRQAPTASFTHIYFSPDGRGDQAALDLAKQALRRLRSAPDRSQAGDIFPGPDTASDLAPVEAQRIFGRSEIAGRLFDAPLQTWQGPFRSGYGWHLIRVTARRPSQVPEFAQVRDDVLADYLAEMRARANRAELQQRRDRYKVTVMDARP